MFSFARTAQEAGANQRATVDEKKRSYLHQEKRPINEPRTGIPTASDVPPAPVSWAVPANETIDEKPKCREKFQNTAQSESKFIIIMIFIDHCGIHFVVTIDHSCYSTAIRHAQKFAKTKTLRRLGTSSTGRIHPNCTGYKYDSDLYWHCYMRHNLMTAHNAVGTCKMGASNDASVVVDPELRYCNLLRISSVHEIL